MRRTSLLFLWLWSGAAPLVAQDIAPASDAAAPTSRIFIAATEKTLWVAETRAKRTQIMWREAVTDFDVLRPIRIAGEIDQIEALDTSVFVQLETGLYEYDRADLTAVPSTISNLPRDARPLALAARDGALFAVVDADVAREMVAPTDPGNEPTPAPDFGAAQYVIAAFRGGSWTPFLPIPSAERQGVPTIIFVDNRLLIAWRETGATTLFTIEIVLDNDRPRETRSQPVEQPGLTKWWLTAVAGVPTLVTLTANEPQRPCAFRWLGGPESRGWSPVDLYLSTLPDDVTTATVDSAVGFNQQIALLTRGSDGAPLLRFAGLGIPATMETTRLGDTLRGPAAALRIDQVIQAITWIILLAVILSISFFRRGSIMRDATLPPGSALALMLQRLLGAAIDIAPIGLVLAELLDVRWREGLSLLAEWGVFAQPEAMRDAALLKWWGLTSLVYAGYACVMEMTIGRTLGKIIMRTWITSDDGQPPRPWQMFARNAFRLIELMPQFWILWLMVLLSRNRQRIGDIFGRTVVVRHVPLPPEPATDKETPGEAEKDDRAD